MVDGDYTSYFSASTNNTFHMAGVSSGLDTNSLIDAIMQKESQPLDKLQEKQESLTNRQTALNFLSDRLNEFRDFTNNWKLQSNFFKIDTTSSDENVARATASGAVQDSNFEFKVNSLAVDESFYSSEFVTGTTSTKLQHLGGYNNGVSENGELTITVNGEVYDPIQYYKGTTLQQLIDNVRSLDSNLNVYTVNSSEGIKLFVSGKDASVDIQISDSADLLESLKMTETFYSGAFVYGEHSDTLDNLGVTSNGTLRFNVDGSDYDFSYDTATSTPASIISAINTDSILQDKIHAYYGTNGSSTDPAFKLFIVAKDPTTDFSVSEAGSGNFLQAMKFFESYQSNEGVTGTAATEIGTLGATTNGSLSIILGSNPAVDFAYNTSPGGDTLQDIIDAINADATLNSDITAYAVESAGTVKLVIASKDGQESFSLSDSGDLLSTVNFLENYASTTEVTGDVTDSLYDLGAVESGRLTVNIGGTNKFVTYNASSGEDTVLEIINKINALDSNIECRYEDTGSAFSITLECCDPDMNISLSDTGDFLSVVNIDQTETSGHKDNGYNENGHTDPGYTEAEDASATLTLSGVSTDISSHTNTFQDVIEGVDVTAYSVQDVSEAPVQISVSKDLDGMVEHVNSFVEEYNDLMNYIYLRLSPEESESTQTDDTALTDAEIAVKGVLKGDPVLRDIFYQLRSMVYRDLDLSKTYEEYYSEILSGTGDSTLDSLGIGSGQLQINIEDDSTTYTVDYSSSETVSEIAEKIKFLNKYISVEVYEDSESFQFFVKGAKNFYINDVSSSEISFSEMMLTNDDITGLKYDYLSEIGIGSSNGLTGGYMNIVKGNIVLDETKLRNLLSADMENVWKAFGESSEAGDTSIEGFGTQLSNTIYDWTKYNSGKIDRVAGSNGSIGQELRWINNQIISWSKRLEMKYNALWAKFSKLEENLGKLQAQSSALQAGLANLTSST